MSPTEVAAICGVREVTVERWEKGKTTLPDQQKFRLAELFEVEVAHLMGWDREPVQTGKAA